MLSRKRGTHAELQSIEDHFLHREKLFRLEITNYKDKQLILSDEFLSSVKDDLPERYDGTNFENRKDYEDFFNDYGHFIVTSNEGGGAVELRVQTLGSQEEKTGAKQAMLKLEVVFNEVISKFVGTGKGNI